MHMTDVSVEGCRISVDLDPPSDRPALLMIHALGTARELFDAQCGALRPSLRLLRYDLRGHGRSETPREPSSIEQLGRDALAVLDVAGVERAHVAGMSIGGLVALWLAIHAPERVDRVVLANTATRIGTRELWQERIAQVERDGLEPLVSQAIARWFTEPFVQRQPATATRFARILAACSVKGYTACCAVLRDADLRARAGEVRAPALVIVGTHDTATPPAEGERLVKLLPGARLLTLAAAHLSNVERADEVNRALLEHLG
jgi:3-oxoadipate enol-lactonase